MLDCIKKYEEQRVKEFPTEPKEIVKKAAWIFDRDHVGEQPHYGFKSYHFKQNTFFFQII